MMLDADVQTGIVVDRTGAVQGLLTVDAIADVMRDGDHAPAFAHETGTSRDRRARTDRGRARRKTEVRA